MVKKMKLICILLLVFTMMFTFSTKTFAVDTTEARQEKIQQMQHQQRSSSSSVDAKGVIESITNGDQKVDTGTITKFGGAIVKVAQVIGIVVAVVVLLVLGIKYLIGSAEEKAEYKKTFVPYIIGAILIFAATTIVNIVYELSTSLQV